MANSNSENPHVGRRFQESVKSILEKKFCTSFEQEAVVAIGKPAKTISLISLMTTGP